MGVLSELNDSFMNKKGYQIAKNIFDHHGKDLNKDEVLSHMYDLARDHFFFETWEWYERLSGRKDQRFFLLYEWYFKDNCEKYIPIIEEICDKDPDLDYEERISNDEDFFLFHPIEHGLGIDIIVHNGLTPDKLNSKFKRICISNPDHPGKMPLVFSW